MSKEVVPFAAGKLTHVPLAYIVDHPDVPLARELDPKHVSDLLESIKQNGLDTPLLVWNGGGDDGITAELKNGKSIPGSFLVAGSHRRAALRKFSKESAEDFAEKFPNGIPVHVIGGELADVIAAQLRENLNRKDLPAEQALPLVRRLRDEFKLKQKVIARKVGKSEAWVSSIFEIEENLGEEGVDEVEEGGVTLRDALKVSKKVKDAKKAGLKINPKEELGKAKASRAAIKATGRVRSEKRTSAKTLWERFNSLPSMAVGKKLEILRAAFAYVAGEDDSEIPSELQDTDEE